VGKLRKRVTSRKLVKAHTQEAWSAIAPESRNAVVAALVFLIRRRKRARQSGRNSTYRTVQISGISSDRWAPSRGYLTGPADDATKAAGHNHRRVVAWLRLLRLLLIARTHLLAIPIALNPPSWLPTKQQH